MRQLLSKHAPDIDPDAEDADGEPPRQRARTGPSLDRLSGNAIASSSSGQAARPLPLDHARPSSSVLADLNVHPTPPSFTPSTPEPTVEPQQLHHLISSTLPPALPPPLPPPPSHDVGVRLQQPSSTTTTTTEALEKQPRDASGYEWDESQHTSAVGTDGTASLSMEPDGEGSAPS